MALKFTAGSMEAGTTKFHTIEIAYLFEVLLLKCMHGQGHEYTKWISLTPDVTLRLVTVVNTLNRMEWKGMKKVNFHSVPFCVLLTATSDHSAKHTKHHYNAGARRGPANPGASAESTSLSLQQVLLYRLTCIGNFLQPVGGYAFCHH